LLIKGKVSKFTLENFGCVKNVAIWKITTKKSL
jgi:hypothetical protein